MQYSWQYIAGFFDGEGCVTSGGKVRPYPKVQMTQVGEQGRVLLQGIAEYMRAFDIESHTWRREIAKYYPGKPWRDVYVLTITKTESQLRFFEHVLPYIYIKKVVVEDFLRVMKLFPSMPTGSPIYNRQRSEEQKLKWSALSEEEKAIRRTRFTRACGHYRYKKGENNHVKAAQAR